MTQFNIILNLFIILCLINGLICFENQTFTNQSQQHRRTKRIINGKDADQYLDGVVKVSFRYKVGNETKANSCTGSVIHQNFILTAAHCW